MEFKDFKNIFFGNDEEYNKIPDNVKSNNKFMINRMMASKFPIHANLMNSIGLDGLVIVDIWRKFCKEQNINFIRFVPVKKSQFIKEFTWYPKDLNMLKRYCSNFEISVKEFEERLKWQPNETKNDFLDYENIFK